ncbi:MAG: FCD domain-containing protein [Bilophila wadsworthia]
MELLKNNDYTEYYDENIRFHGIFLSLSENILLEQTLIPLRRRLYDFPRRQYSYEWESMNLYTHQRFIDSVKLGNREAAVSIFRIEHWSYEVHKKYFKLYYDFDQKNDAPASALGQPQRGTLLVSQLNQRGQAIRVIRRIPPERKTPLPSSPDILGIFAEKTLL